MNMFIYNPGMSVVAVVGGTGFLGTHAARALREAGHEVRTLSRRTGFDALRPDPAALRAAEAVVNLAGIKREEGAQTFRAVHVEAVERLAAAMREAGVRRLVHVSVTAAKEKPDRPYPHTKWLGEQAVRASGLDWTILRPGVIYGEGDDLLAHLVAMIRAAPVFPIVGAGTAPMMPVDARDVAAAVAGALRNPGSIGRAYEVVGPERLALRDVVSRVAAAVGLPLLILPTPVALMRLPVFVMEKFARRPLSTRAQLHMLVEGLAGDPEPARRDLGVDPAPFTAERLRLLVEKVAWRLPVDLRLLSAPRGAREVRTAPALALVALAAAALTGVFAGLRDVWLGMTAAMGALGAAALLFRPVRSRLRASPLRVLAGLAAGGALYGLTRLALVALGAVWPGWTAQAGALFAWREGHGPAFLLPTLAMIVLAEELLWRGVVARWAVERLGRPGGLAVAALVYALAHLATMNPVLLLAAVVLGLVWGWLSVAVDDLVVPTACHLAWDLLLLFGPPIV
jgi:NADH dehydrogenase